MVIVAILEVRRAQLDGFRAFERAAARLMRAHGGAIERAIVVDDGAAERVTEIHVVRFPDAAAFAAYRDSAELAALAPARAAAVASTRLYFGEDGPHYAE